MLKPFLRRPWAALVLLASALSAGAQVAPLEVVLVPTLMDPALEAYENVVPGAQPEVSRTHQVFPGQEFIVLTLIGGIAFNEETGDAQVGFDVVLFSPEGELLRNRPDLVAARGPTWAPGGYILARDRVGFSLDADQPRGTYELQATVIDRLGNNGGVASATVELVDFDAGEPFADLEEARAWMMSHHADPTPQRLVALLRGGMGLATEMGTVAEPFVVGFAEGIMRRHPFLLEHLLADFESLELAAQHDILYVVSRLERLAEVSATIRAEHAEFLELAEFDRYPSHRSPFLDVRQIEAQWGEFHATGRMEPLRRVVDNLGLLRFAGSMARYSHLPEPTAEQQQAMLADVLYQESAASLYAYVPEDSLAYKYCEFIYFGPRTPEAIKTQLEQLIRSILGITD